MVFRIDYYVRKFQCSSSFLYKVPPNEVRDLDFANDASKILASAAAKLEKQSTQNDRKLTTKLLTDLIYFVTDTENTGGETLVCMYD